MSHCFVWNGFLKILSKYNISIQVNYHLATVWCGSVKSINIPASLWPAQLVTDVQPDNINQPPIHHQHEILHFSNFDWGECFTIFSFKGSIHSSIQLFQLVTVLSVVKAAPSPVVDNPYLSILINRRDLGSSFDLGVDKANTNLVVTGE